MVSRKYYRFGDLQRIPNQLPCSWSILDDLFVHDNLIVESGRQKRHPNSIARFEPALFRKFLLCTANTESRPLRDWN